VDLVPIITSAAPAAPIFYDMVDFHGLRIERQSEQTGVDESRHGRAIAEVEMAMVRACDVTIAVSDVEAQIVSEREPDATVVVLPNIHQSPRSSAAFDQRHGLMFIGSWRHIPNRDAIDFLCNEIMPLVWQQASDITVSLVGSDIPIETWAAIDDRILVHGWVQDLDPLFEEVRCTIAPLRFGAGIKGKVGDSLVRGVPVVTTEVGAEGFGDVANSLLIGKGAQELADQIVRLHQDSVLWYELADLGYEGVAAKFGYEASRTALVAALAQVGVPMPDNERLAKQ